MIWLLRLHVPPALVVVFAAVTLPAALIAAAIGVRLVRPGRGNVGLRMLGGILIGYGLIDVLTLVYFLAFWPGELLPLPG